MDDDPWGSSADPWNATISGAAAAQGVDAGESSPKDTDDLKLASSLSVPARGSSFSEADPWASPILSRTNAGTSPSPPAALAINLPGGDRENDISLPKEKWVTEDIVDDNAWMAPKASALPASSAIIEDRPLQSVSAEQVPLPDDEYEQAEDRRMSRHGSEEVLGETWNPAQMDDEGLNAVFHALPPLPEAPPRFVEEDETFNPFSHRNPTQADGAEEVPQAFASSPHDDDDAFGGFNAGGIEESHQQFGFTGAGADDSFGGWGNEENAQDFGGAWGSSSVGNAMEDEDQTPFQSANIDETSIDDDDGFHSVPARQRSTATAEQLKEDEWEEARRRIESQEARAPVALINKLADQWKDVLHKVFMMAEPLDTGKEVEDGLNPEAMIRKDRLMRKITELPDGMSIYVQPTQNTATWALYQDYLATVKLDPSASILAKASAESAYRAARRKSQEEHDAWQARSRLGEAAGHDPSAHSSSTMNQDAEGSRSKWSLWGRKASTPTVPLTTSGGGILEVKGLSPNPTGTQADGKTGMIGALTSVSASSRSTTPPIRSSDSPRLPEHDVGSVDPAPSAVGRFLGRFRRSKSGIPSVNISNKDLELSQDDFSFLADVPALPAKANAGVANLVSLDDTKPSEQMASLEAMLNSAPLPMAPHLNPPPRPSVSRGNSTAPMQSHSASKSNSMIDLFGNLDLSSTTAPKASTPATSGFQFDALMTAASPPVAQRNQPVQPPAPMIPKPHNARSDSKRSNLNIAASLEDDGFGDFKAQSQGLTNNNFDIDDFGDFEQFQNNSTSKTDTKSTLLSASPSKSQRERVVFPSQIGNTPRDYHVQPSPSRLDHSSTAKLVQTAARNSSQWPASPSPSIPALPPPTSINPLKSATVTTSASATSFQAGTSLNFDFLAAGPALVAPPRANSASPAMSFLSASNAVKRSQTPPQLSKGQGLSASDLSFFDSL